MTALPLRRLAIFRRGRHQRPSLKARLHARNLAYDAETERLFAEMHAEVTGGQAAVVLPVTPQHPDTGPPLWRPVEVAHEPGPLMPLPPEVAHADESAGWALYGDVKVPLYAVQPDGGVIHFVSRPNEPEPEDPHDVASDEQEADAYVGPPQPGDPYLEHLASRQYADSTGTFAAIAGGE